MKRTSVDLLVARRLGLSRLSADTVQQLQMQSLRKTVRHAIANSSFYWKQYGEFDPDCLQTREDLAKMPFLSGHDIQVEGHLLLCVSQSKVERVITLQTSGSIGLPKRLSFTAADLAGTSDFFLHGMQSLITEDDNVLVLLPFEQPASVGAFLIDALAKGGFRAEGMWPPKLDQRLAEFVKHRRITSVVGLPQHLLALSGLVSFGQIITMLVCSDYASPLLRKRIEENCGCETFLHYGATESGLGGAVECSAHAGCHIRESDLLVEIIDPQTGEQLADGMMGEVVITTLGREAMPLIRYRTGDMACLDRTVCVCGGMTARLDNIRGRLNGCDLGDGVRVFSQDIDDSLYILTGLLDYRVTLDRYCGSDRLLLEYIAVPGSAISAEEIQRVVIQVPGIRESVASGKLVFGEFQKVEGFAATHTLKRTILDIRTKEVKYATCS
jgi:phenylacetate-coenzyme A ligase PaaK-like adenylate-forming protein